MRLAITSDLHLGDPACQLVAPAARGGHVLGPAYDAFKAAAGTDNDYLVLLGDVFDVAFATYAEAYTAARTFLQAVARDRIANELIYVPGNHDFSVWTILLHEANVIGPIRRGEHVRRRWTVAGVLDDLHGTGLFLDGVSRRQGSHGPYGGLFLDDLSGLKFNVAYPNLYLVGRREQSFILTHGQYFQTVWSFLGEHAKQIAGDDLVLGGGDQVRIDDIVSLNLPVGEVTSAGVGMAGPLTEVLLKVKNDLAKGDVTRLERYVQAAAPVADALAEFPLKEAYKEWGSDLLIWVAKSLALKALQGLKPARYQPEFSAHASDRIARYHAASLLEIARLQQEAGLHVPLPTGFIYGHTHVPCPWGYPDVVEAAGTPLQLFNTGGWLLEHDRPSGAPAGAAVFRYESTAGFSSKLVKLT